MATPKKPSPEVATSGAPVPPVSLKFTDKVNLFAETCDLQPVDVEAKFVTLVGKPSDKAADRLGSEKLSTFDDLAALFSDVPKAVLREAIDGLRDITVTITPVAAAPVGANPSLGFSAAVLPVLPDDAMLLDVLKTGGVAKVDSIDVVAAAQVLLAEGLGVYGLEKTVSEKILVRYEELGEPCPQVYYDLRKEVNRRSYAEVLNALGASGTDMSDGAKNRLLVRVKPLFGNLENFQKRLEAWWDQWMAQGQNPAMMMQAMMSIGSGVANPFAQLAQQPPDTSIVITAQEGFIDACNGMFGGTGKVVARAMAADALATRKILENSDLVAAIGASSREEMLKKLGLSVSSDIVRANRDASQYILGVMDLNKKSSAELPSYIVALMSLGKQIPWDVLSGRAKSKSMNPMDGKPFPGGNGHRTL